MLNEIIIALAIFVAGGGAGWYFTSNVYDAEISGMKTTEAVGRASAAEASLDEFKSTADSIHKSAVESRDDIAALRKSMDQLKKERKNEKPLPVDCVPDSERLRNFQSAVTATNKAITGN